MTKRVLSVSFKAEFVGEDVVNFNDKGEAKKIAVGKDEKNNTLYKPFVSSDCILKEAFKTPHGLDFFIQSRQGNNKIIGLMHESKLIRGWLDTIDETKRKSAITFTNATPTSECDYITKCNYSKLGTHSMGSPEKRDVTSKTHFESTIFINLTQLSYLSTFIETRCAAFTPEEVKNEKFVEKFKEMFGYTPKEEIFFVGNKAGIADRGVIIRKSGVLHLLNYIFNGVKSFSLNRRRAYLKSHSQKEITLHCDDGSNLKCDSLEEALSKLQTLELGLELFTTEEKDLQLEVLKKIRDNKDESKTKELNNKILKLEDELKVLEDRNNDMFKGKKIKDENDRMKKIEKNKKDINKYHNDIKEIKSGKVEEEHDE